MSAQHKGLASGRWAGMPLCEQMAHIGSEVSRALNWRKKNNEKYCRKAIDRSLELLGLSIDSAGNTPALKEIARLREAVVDYFYGANEFASSEALWMSYFDHFTYRARNPVLTDCKRCAKTGTGPSGQA